MDLAAADRYQIPHELVWFSREAYEADIRMASSDSEEKMDVDQERHKTTEDLWNDILTELDLQREGLFHAGAQTPPAFSNHRTTTASHSSLTNYGSDYVLVSDVETPDFSSPESETTEPLIFEMELDADVHTSDFVLPPMISPLLSPATSSRHVQYLDLPSLPTRPPPISRIPSTSTDGGYGSGTLDSDEEEGDATTTVTTLQQTEQRTSLNSQLWYALRQRTENSRRRKSCARRLFFDRD